MISVERLRDEVCKRSSKGSAGLSVPKYFSGTCSTAHLSLDRSNVGESPALAEEEVACSVEHEERRHPVDTVCTHYILPHCIHDVQPQYQSLALKVSFQPVYDRPCRQAYGSIV